jgi:hypothetical protein
MQSSLIVFRPLTAFSESINHHLKEYAHIAQYVENVSLAHRETIESSNPFSPTMATKLNFPLFGSKLTRISLKQSLAQAYGGGR